MKRTSIFVLFFSWIFIIIASENDTSYFAYLELSKFERKCLQELQDREYSLQRQKEDFIGIYVANADDYYNKDKYNEAKEWYDKAARLGDAYSYGMIGYINECDSTISTDETLKYYVASAHLSSPEFMLFLARLYYATGNIYHTYRSRYWAQMSWFCGNEDAQQFLKEKYMFCPLISNGESLRKETDNILNELGYVTIKDKLDYLNQSKLDAFASILINSVGDLMIGYNFADVNKLESAVQEIIDKAYKTDLQPCIVLLEHSDNTEESNKSYANICKILNKLFAKNKTKFLVIDSEFGLGSIFLEQGNYLYE